MEFAFCREQFIEGMKKLGLRPTYTHRIYKVPGGGFYRRYHGDARAIHSLITGEFTLDDVYVKGEWMHPAGVFHGAEGGPC